jgi:uncharacterized protein (DUF58 family)
VGKEEYEAKAEGYKALFALGLLLTLFGIVGTIASPVFLLLAALGIFLVVASLIIYTPPSVKNEASTRTRCRFCGAEMPENAKFCPRCGRCQV